MVNFAKYIIVKFLIYILNTVSDNISKFCAKDPFNFVETLCNNFISSDQMCSFDITDLFTYVPLEETTDRVTVLCHNI